MVLLRPRHSIVTELIRINILRETGSGPYVSVEQYMHSQEWKFTTPKSIEHRV